MKTAAQKYPFVYYRLPNEKEVRFIQAESPAIELDSLQNMPEKPGFILYPFAPNKKCKPLFIQADKQSRMSLDDIPKYDFHRLKPSVISKNLSKTKKEYSKMIAGALEEIKSGALQKVVLSRLKFKKGTAILNPLMFFHQLCRMYPSAFVSYVLMPGNKLWVTATPELLVSANRSEIKTVSLAGTKRRGSLEVWGLKEIMEQQIVTDYINKILEKYCINISVSDAHEVIAGNVKHLKTSFSATLKADFWNLVSALHPTPAVCGLPLKKAMTFIKQTEGYDRKYYTGFLGPCNMEGKTDLFVNLRCAELFANGTNFYVGGGITKDSIPEKEWEETELKAKTLLSVFENKDEEE